MFSVSIDGFGEDSGPISDSGRWLQLMQQGSNDVTVSNEFPFSGARAAHRNLGAPTFGAPGPGYVLRTADPGPGYDSEMGVFSSGIRGTIRLLCRSSIDGLNHYRAEWISGGSSMEIYRQDAGVDTLLGTVGLPTGGTNEYQGFAVYGDTLTAYYNSGSGWVPLLSVTDATYDFGYIGFGVRDGIFGTASVTQSLGMTVPAPSQIGRGVHAAPFTFHYSNDPAHAIAA